MKVDLDIRVVELLCSRLCHELVSPVGAINNGVELIEEMGTEMVDEAIDLIAHSADQAARRLRLLRLAYGAAGAESTAGLAEAQQAAASYFADTKITLDWPPGGLPDALAARRGVAKLLLNLFVLAEEALAHGGTIRLSLEERAVVVSALGRAALKPETRAALDGDTSADALGPRTVHAYATGRFADEYDLGIEIREAAERLDLRLTT